MIFKIPLDNRCEGDTERRQEWRWRDQLGRRWQTQGPRGPNPALHLVLSNRAPCFYPVAAPSSLSLVKEQLHVHSPKITLGPLKARLMRPPGKTSLTPLTSIIVTSSTNPALLAAGPVNQLRHVMFSSLSSWCCTGASYLKTEEGMVRRSSVLATNLTLLHFACS